MPGMFLLAKSQKNFNGMKTKFFLAVWCAVAAIANFSCDDDDDNKSISTSDRAFIDFAAKTNFTEIDFATLANSNASDQRVRDFAQHMITEHTQAQADLKDLGDHYKLTQWPTELDSAHQAMKTTLTGLSGYSFDSAYLASQVNDHQVAVTEFKNKSANADRGDVRDYAKKYLPHIQEHLDMADSIMVAMSNERSVTRH